MKDGSFLLGIVRGAVGKKYVVKHYRHGTVVTKYPDMKGIVPSVKQKTKRRLFRKAVLWAQGVYKDALLKEEWRKKLRKPKRLFQALMKLWSRRRKEKEEKNVRRIERWRRNVRANRKVMVYDVVCLKNDVMELVE